MKAHRQFLLASASPFAIAADSFARLRLERDQARRSDGEIHAIVDARVLEGAKARFEGDGA
ncbi:hypothetical protein [Oricola sp.]|uniref:hypothetical protein n=1 Tax=Oricola sp. TaxID=1979950 RepID=UPI0025CE74EA|nr:hypothetical protein [Oricola sp.]MCI5075667.1 hypothetical protein [Oricola sp.]